MTTDPTAFVGPLAYGLLHRQGVGAALPLPHAPSQQAQLRLLLGASGLGESPELQAALNKQKLLVAHNSAPLVAVQHRKQLDTTAAAPREGGGMLRTLGSAPVPLVAAVAAAAAVDGKFKTGAAGGGTPRRRTADDAYTRLVSPTMAVRGGSGRGSGNQQLPQPSPRDVTLQLGDDAPLAAFATGGTPGRARAATADNHPQNLKQVHSSAARHPNGHSNGDQAALSPVAAAAQSSWLHQAGVMTTPTRRTAASVLQRPALDSDIGGGTIAAVDEGTQVGPLTQQRWREASASSDSPLAAAPSLASMQPQHGEAGGRVSPSAKVFSAAEEEIRYKYQSPREWL